MLIDVFIPKLSISQWFSSWWVIFEFRLSKIWGWLIFEIIMGLNLGLMGILILLVILWVRIETGQFWDGWEIMIDEELIGGN